MELREKIARIIVPHIADVDWAKSLHYTIADSILSIPEIADALRLVVVGPLEEK